MQTGLDLQLVVRAQQGDDQAFTALFSRHKVRVYSLCLRMTGNPASAEDLTQDAFLQAFLKLSTFQGKSAFSTWLHRVVVNVVLVHLRRKTLQVVAIEDLSPDVNHLEQHEPGSDDPRLRTTPDRIDLLQAFDQLPQGYRTAIRLHDVEGYEHGEITRLTRWSVGTSKSQLYRGRQRLRQLLAPSRTRPDSEKRRCIH